jgi:pyrroline-5-carboxylate reductase
MGEALISAGLRGGVFGSTDVTVSDVSEQRRDILSRTHGVVVTADSAAAVNGCELIVLAVKPQDFPTIGAGLQAGLTERQTVISIMAGVPIQKLVQELEHQAVVRVMPNTPALVGEAMSVWYAAPAVSAQAKDSITLLLRAAGREMEASDERYLDMATALNGSGPGFLFFILEAMIDGGVKIGLSDDLARELAVQTFVGSAVLARETGRPPAELRSMVTSKGGTTAAGLARMEEGHVREAIVAAVEAAHARAQELSA